MTNVIILYYLIMTNVIILDIKICKQPIYYLIMIIIIILNIKIYKQTEASRPN